MACDGHGAVDPFVSKEEVENFTQAMNDGKFDYQFISDAGAVHAFTNPAADKIAASAGIPIADHAAADRRSWAHRQAFCREVLGGQKPWVFTAQKPARLALGRRFRFLPGMDLAAARAHITSALARMNAAYGQPVFDEWAVLGLGGNRGVLAYAGPRPESFRRDLPDDAVPLRAEAAGQLHGVGDIVFALEADGTRYDAFLRLGESSYLVCNHTGRTIAEIRANPGWLKVQPVLFELGEKFRADPLVES